MIKGAEGMSIASIRMEISKGGRFVVFPYCISLVVITFRRYSQIHFIRAGESAFTAGIGYTMLSLLMGWWGIPFGPIYTIGSIFKNLGGGKDVTQDILDSFGDNIRIRES